MLVARRDSDPTGSGRGITMRGSKEVLRGWRQPVSAWVAWGFGGALLALLALSPALARAETISGTTTEIASGNVLEPSFEYPLVAWLDVNSGDVVYFDEHDGSTHDIGIGGNPAVGGGRIAFVCASLPYEEAAGICLYDPATQQTTSITADPLAYAPSLSSELAVWVGSVSVHGFCR